MKKHFIIIFVVLLAILVTNCNDDFMERYPLDEVSNETFWRTTSDLEIFINGIYDFTADHRAYTTRYRMMTMLLGNQSTRYNDSYTSDASIDYMSDDMAPILGKSSTEYWLKYKTGNNTPPTYSMDGQNTDGWFWDVARITNTFMDNYQRAVDIPEIVMNQYVAEVRLFRGWFYRNKVKRFGDVPLFTSALNISDTIILFGPREPRSDVMDLVLEDLNFACEYLPEDWHNGSPGWMNKWAALALKSRICLYEGSYQKYHGGSDANMWFTEAANAAQEIMNSGEFTLFSSGDSTTDYRHSFHQTDLEGNSEIIYWKKHIDGINPDAEQNYFMAYHGGLSKDFVDDYLCTDGLPIGLSPLYMGDDSLETSFMNRDPRMRQTIIHPDDDGPDNPLHLAGGSLLPHPRLNGQEGGIKSRTGYHTIKFYDDNSWSHFGHGNVAAIFFRYGEVLLNYAEAKAELGDISQSDLDETVNLLRDRVGMPHIDLGDIAIDPKYTYMGLSPIITEIRRERRIELLGEGFRYDDLIRWKIAHIKLNMPTLGIQWDDAAIARWPGAIVKTTVDPDNGKSYIDVYKESAYETTNFTDKNYLWPIPVWVLSENPVLGQNPGW